ncbi:hypothetical protein ES703_39182 [subsurface metagenome]
MKHNGVTFDEHRLKGLNTHSMEGGGAVEQDRMLVNDFFQNVPDLLVTSFNHPLGAFNRIGQAVLFKLANDERLIQFEGYFLRQATLIQFQIRSYYDNRPR